MIVVNRVVEKVMIKKHYKEIVGIDVLDGIIDDSIDIIKEMFDFYNRSSKYEIAIHYSNMLIKKTMDLYNKYHEYFFDKNISNWTVGSIIGKRIECYIKN